MQMQIHTWNFFFPGLQGRSRAWRWGGTDPFCHPQAHRRRGLPGESRWVGSARHYTGGNRHRRGPARSAEPDDIRGPSLASTHVPHRKGLMDAFVCFFFYILEARARPGLRSLCGGRSRRVAPLAAGGSNRQLLSRHTAMVGSQMLPVRGYVVFTRCQAPPSVPGGVLIPPAAWR